MSARENIPEPLSEESFSDALDFLSGRDPDIANVIDRHGKPPMWHREPGFPTLVHIILEQQVSLASAKAAFDRLCESVSPLTPSGFLTLDNATLKLIGFSRQKASYCRLLSGTILNGDLDLHELENMDDQKARAELTELKGIGPWTADIYLLVALRRPDIWPSTDLAITVGMRKLKNLGDNSGSDDLSRLSDLWRPWRSVAARVIWHYYLSN